jgi:hypothetical protein
MFNVKSLAMKNLLRGLLVMFIISITMFSCKEDEDPIPTTKEFVGSLSCKECHQEKYNDWVSSGHPYKFTIVENGVEPTYPAEAQNFQSSWLTGLGDGSHDWDDIAGVIGGYGWKTRFVGKDGHIIGSAGSSYSSGLGHNQINFYGGENHGWVDYEKTVTDKVYKYSCFKCHTTGGSEEGTWLDGVDGLGTFTEGGIGCESCHGPGNIHAVTESASDIDLVYEFAHTDNESGGLTVNGIVQLPNESGNDVNFLCGTCHNRGYTNKIDSKGGFIKHHEQWDEIVSGVHKNISCTECHDPHKRTIWDGDGIIKQCTECHSSITKINHAGNATCIDCHMPFAAKSGTSIGESGYEGDVRSHLMKIIVEDANMFVEDGSAVRDDSERAAGLSLEYSCLGCHNRDANDNISEKTLQQALMSAGNMHE